MVRTRLNTSTNPDSGAKMENPKKGEGPAMKKGKVRAIKKPRNCESSKKRGILRRKRKDKNPGEEIPAAKKKMKIGEVGDSQAAETVVPTVVPTVVEGESSTPVVGGSSTVPEPVPETVVEESTTVVPPVVEREESEEEEENEPEKEAAEPPEEAEGERSGGEATTSGSSEATRSEDQSERPSEEGREVSKKLSGKTW